MTGRDGRDNLTHQTTYWNYTSNGMVIDGARDQSEDI